MEIFAGKDKIQSARMGDSNMLNYCLENDEGLKDFMVKVFNSRYHRFAHIGISLGDNNDDVEVDGSGGKKRKDVKSDNFLEEEFGGDGEQHQQRQRRRRCRNGRGGSVPPKHGLDWKPIPGYSFPPPEYR